MDKLPTETIKQSPKGNTTTIATTKTINESNITKADKPKRYKLQRSTENFDDHCEAALATTTTTRDNATCHVMGGGFATPPASYSTQYTPNAVSDKAALLTNLSNETDTEIENENETIPTNTISKTNKNITNATAIVAKIRHNHSALDLPMHEKLLENDGCENKQPSKDKTEKLKTKSHKESKFAEKLRRSFRRAEHKSLEIKRQDKKDQGDLAAAQERSSSLRPLQPQLHNSASIFSLTNLPGLGGHINPALLLDSPDESTPPEFAYRHLSSVATTNSSTSLESNFCESPTTSISYWAWHINNNNMGVEHSTANNTQSNQSTGKLLSNNDNRKRLEQQSSSKSDYEHATPVTTASRSCSSASESSTAAAKLTRLQNFLFKSSNESSRSIQGHSNEGFTVSSFNSSSGEWENLCNLPSSSCNNQPSIEEAPSLAKDSEEPSITALALTTASNTDNNGSARNYYQYTLASPNNPFLPEITARTYHSTYEEEEEDILEAQRELEDELDANVTSVKYRIGTHSAQLPTPNYSRTGSQESTHSEYGPSHSLEPQLYGQSLGSSSSAGSMASPGKHKRKLFSLSTPNKLNFPSPPQGHQQQQQPPSFSSLYQPSIHNKSLITSDSSSPTSYQQQQQQQQHKSVTKTSSCNLVRSLNPFLPSTTVTSSSPPQRTASSSSLNKRTGPLKQQAVTSPIAVPLTATAATTKDLNARREEFLRATMQICLVVSPPSSRLQLKSKSLTHLDGLESEMVCNPVKNSNNALASISSTLNSAYPLTPPSSLSPPLPQHQHHHYQTQMISKQRSLSPVRSTLQPKMPTLYSCTRLNTRLTPTIYTQAPQQLPASKSFGNNLHSLTSHAHVHAHAHAHAYSHAYIVTQSCATTTTTTACCKSRICSAHVGSGGAAAANCSNNNSSSNSNSVSNLPLQSSSHHYHYHNNKFQSEPKTSTAALETPSTSTTTTTATGSITSSCTQYTLKPLPLPSASDNANANSNSSLSLPMSDVASNSSTTSASSLYPPYSGAGGGGSSVGGCITPTSYKKKTSFLQRKKPILTRSEVSSSEYFSVSFCTESGCQDEEFFPATKGVTLANALSQALRRRNLSFSQLTITDSNDNNQTPAFLEASSSPLQTSLDENTEVENLAGHHLIIMDKDSSRKILQKAASFGSRNRPPRLLSSASTDESTDVNLTGKQLKQRWSGLFGVKNPQQSQLCELLNNYSKNGVPQKTPATLSFDHPDLLNAIDYLDNRHKSWMDIVESSGMNDSEMRIQTAIWELVTTEVDYIHCLQTVTDLFLACLEAVQEEGLLKEVDQHRLFANIRDICEANLKFWTFYLYPMVAHSINTREPLRVAFFQQGFIAFANIFAPYKKYCAEQSTCQFYCKELNRTNSLFTSYLAWCESQKMCNRLRLADILVRPMQRLTKYSLLLAAIKKHMTDVDEIEAIDTMLHTTENFVFSVNNHLTTRQENERLKGVMARIESYDVVDTNNEHLEKMIKQYSQMFDLCGPMKGCASQHVRHLFMEGDHKYKDNLGKVEVHCFLLTDMLLVCKSIAKKGLGTLKVIRQPYLTDRLIVQHSNNLLSCVYLNEFQVAISAFTLQCTEAKNWYEALKRAKMIYTRLKQSSMTPWDSMRYAGSTVDSLGVKKSPMNSSICSHVTSANNSHSGSVEWNDSRNISVEFDKTNSLSSDEGITFLGAHGYPLKGKPVTTISPQKLKVNTTSSSNMLTVQPLNSLGQSLPNLNLHHSHTNLYHTYSNNTLLVPGTANSAHSGNLLLSPSHRGISYPPPSPTRVPLRRGMAFSSSIKNPPLLKTRNITSQNSINWHQIPATPTPTSPQSQQQQQQQQQTSQATSNVAAIAAIVSNNQVVNTIAEQDNEQQLINEAATTTTMDCTGVQLTNNPNFSTQLSNSTETDV